MKIYKSGLVFSFFLAVALAAFFGNAHKAKAITTTGLSGDYSCVDGYSLNVSGTPNSAMYIHAWGNSFAGYLDYTLPIGTTTSSGLLTISNPFSCADINIGSFTYDIQDVTGTNQSSQVSYSVGRFNTSGSINEATPIQITKGQAGSATFAMNTDYGNSFSGPGFSYSISYGCSISPSSVGISCTVSPSSGVPSGGQTNTISIQTTSATVSQVYSVTVTAIMSGSGGAWSKTLAPFNINVIDARIVVAAVNGIDGTGCANDPTNCNSIVVQLQKTRTAPPGTWTYGESTCGINQACNFSDVPQIGDVYQALCPAVGSQVTINGQLYTMTSVDPAQTIQASSPSIVYLYCNYIAPITLRSYSGTLDAYEIQVLEDRIAINTWPEVSSSWYKDGNLVGSGTGNQYLGSSILNPTSWNFTFSSDNTGIAYLSSLVHQAFTVTYQGYINGPVYHLLGSGSPDGNPPIGTGRYDTYVITFSNGDTATVYERTYSGSTLSSVTTPIRITAYFKPFGSILVNLTPAPSSNYSEYSINVNGDGNNFNSAYSGSSVLFNNLTLNGIPGWTNYTVTCSRTGWPSVGGTVSLRDINEADCSSGCTQAKNQTFPCDFTSQNPPPGAFTLNAAATVCNGTSSQVQLTWTASTNATSYDVYRTPGTTPYATGVSSPWTDTAVIAGSSYTYFIRAKNAAGTTDSNSINNYVVTYCYGDIIVNSSPTGSTYTLSGPPLPSPGYLSGTTNQTHSSQPLGSWTLGNIVPPTNYTVSSVSPADPQILSPGLTTKPTITFTINLASFSVPVITSGSASCSSGNANLSLTWNAVSGATGYKVYKYNWGTSTYQATDVGNVTSYSLSNVAQGMPGQNNSAPGYQVNSFNGSHWFEVTAYNGNGEGAFSNQYQVATPVCQGNVIVNSSPTGAAYTIRGKATLSGTTNYTHSGQQTDPPNPYTLAGADITPPSGYTFSSIAPSGTQYLNPTWYQASLGYASTPAITFTINLSSGSGVTADIKANGSDAPPPIAYGTSATISWTSANASSCTVTSTPASVNWTGISNTGVSSGNLTSSTTYFLSCTGTAGGNASDSVTVNVLPPSSFTLNAAATVCNGTASQVQLTWTAYSGATSYDVYKNGGLYVTNVSSPWTDTAVTAGASYSYVIYANVGASSIPSNTVSLTVAYCGGNITVNAALNGSAWSGALSYSITGCNTLSGSSVSTSYYNVNLGSCTLNFISGGPAGASFTEIDWNGVFCTNTLACTQTLFSGQTTQPAITFTVNFTSGSYEIRGKVCEDINGNGVCDSGEPFLVDPAYSDPSGYCTDPNVILAGVSMAYSGPAAGSTTLNQCSPTSHDPIFSVTGLPSGTYTITANVPSGWQVTGAQSNGGAWQAGTNSISVATPYGGNAWGVGLFAAEPPTSFTLTADSAICNGTNSQVQLTWGALAGATTYDVWRNYMLDASNVSSGWIDTYVTPGTSYDYVIKTNSGANYTNNVDLKVPYCYGDIIVNSSPTGDSYTLSGPGSQSGSTNLHYTLQPLGVWTLNNVAPPANYVYNSVSPSNPQTLPSGRTTKPTITFNVLLSAGSIAADIKANGSDGPISIAYNSTATISWTSTNATACTVTSTPASVNWSGTSGSNPSGGLTSNKTYNLICTGPGGKASDSVTVNVLPASFTLNAASTVCNGTASQVQLTWGASANFTSYDVWRNGAVYATGVTSPWTDTSVTPGTAYTYVIHANNAVGFTPSNSINPTVTYCSGNLTVNATLNGSAWTGAVNLYHFRLCQFKRKFGCRCLSQCRFGSVHLKLCFRRSGRFHLYRQQSYRNSIFRPNHPTYRHPHINVHFSFQLHTQRYHNRLRHRNSGQRHRRH